MARHPESPRPHGVIRTRGNAGPRRQQRFHPVGTRRGRDDGGHEGTGGLKRAIQHMVRPCGAGEGDRIPIMWNHLIG